MKVALLTNFIPPYRHGIFGAIGSRCNLRIFVSTDMEPNRRWVPDRGDLTVVSQKSVMIPVMRRHPAGFRDLGFLHIPADTLRQLRQMQPDVVISAEMGVRSIQAAVYKLLRPRTVFALWATLSERSEQGRGWLRSTVRRWLLQRADLVFVNGSSGQRYLESLGFDSKKIHLLPYTLGHNVKDVQRTPGNGTVRMLYAGQLIPRKGVLRFARMLADWLKEHSSVRVFFRIVGEGEEYKLLSQLSIPPNLTITTEGPVPHSEMPRLMCQSDMTVYPTLCDEWGMISDSLSVGVPVLGSIHSQAVDELIVSGVNGWRFDPESPKSTLAAIAAACLNSPERLSAMCDPCKESVAHLHPEFVAEKTVGLLLHVTAAMNAPRATSIQDAA